MHEVRESIIEIFSSVQGEGLYLGCRQVFLRFENCNLQCYFCDTEFQAGNHPLCRVETQAGSHEFCEIFNPLSLREIAQQIQNVIGDVPHHSLSLTGGEPLLHTACIHALAKVVPLPLFLETNGTLPEALAEVLDDVRYISMDIKLPSATGKNLWEAHRAFLRLAKQRKTYVKIVITAETAEDEFLTAVSLVAQEAKDLPLILQPVTPYGGMQAIPPARALQLQEQALRYLPDVRLIPQAHRMMGQL